jgi:hypothetical protein
VFVIRQRNLGGNWATPALQQIQHLGFGVSFSMSRLCALAFVVVRSGCERKDAKTRQRRDGVGASLQVPRRN